MKAIFIGSNPSNAALSFQPFCLSTKSGKTMVEWVVRAELIDYYFMNIVDLPTPKNRPLTKKEILACKSLLEIKIKRHGPAKIVAVGKAAANALTLLRIPFFEMPHPSGLNRKLNDPQFLEEKIKGLKNYLEAN